jgi:hypothetical protein
VRRAPHPISFGKNLTLASKGEEEMTDEKKEPAEISAPLPLEKCNKIIFLSGGESIMTGHAEERYINDKCINGYFIPESQARALWDGARVVIEFDEGEAFDDFNLKPQAEIKAAIALLKKGVGHE